MKVEACIFKSLCYHLYINLILKIEEGYTKQTKMLSDNITEELHKKNVTIPSSLAKSTLENIYCPEYRLLFISWKENKGLSLANINPETSNT